MPKTDLAEVQGSVGAKAIAQLVGGVELDDGPARAAAARVVDDGRSRSLVEVTMTEGRKREVRRMFDVVGHPVRRLVREAIGPIRDRQLKPGEWRELTLTEVRSLYAAATEL